MINSVNSTGSIKMNSVSFGKNHTAEKDENSLKSFFSRTRNRPQEGDEFIYTNPKEPVTRRFASWGKDRPMEIEEIIQEHLKTSEGKNESIKDKGFFKSLLSLGFFNRTQTRPEKD
ncbi:MAG: hypothetical protein AB1782_09045 [Cyanobacteriota bacterium]